MRVMMSCLLGISCMLRCAPAPSVNSDMHSRFLAIQKSYGILVRHAIGDDFFPETWRNPPVAARAAEINPAELERFPAIIGAALAAYPPNVIKKNLKEIRLAREMYFFETSYGATSSDCLIYLSDRGSNEGFTDTYLIGSIHHEFAHILYANYDFPQRQWRSALPRGFSYRGHDNGGLEAISKGADSLAGSVELYARGFLNEYSLASLEEDVCIYSETILTSPEEFMTLAEKYPAIETKFKIWLKFYHSIDSSFTVEHLVRAHPIP